VEARLYTDLVRWYRLIDPPADHAEEAAAYGAALERAASPRPETLLELGAGAGHNAVHLKKRFRCTLSDLSPEMQRLSAELNPECEHVLGDMRTLRLGRTFDAVLIHDAIVYMLTEADLAAAVATAFVHTRPGGAAVFAPDWLRDDFREKAGRLDGAEGALRMEGIEWAWDPDPADTTYVADYAFALRDEAGVQVVHDRHLEGLFSRATWLRILGEAGWEAGTFERDVDEDDGTRTVFAARRPG
jgi:SAM-dependent methyltransferase